MPTAKNMSKNSVLVVCETESDSQAVHMFFFWNDCKEKNKTNLVKVTKEFTSRKSDLLIATYLTNKNDH